MAVRMTQATIKVLEAFLVRPADNLSGADIAKITSLLAGTLYPILSRLEKLGWLKSEWEKIDPALAGRPRRKFYKLTALGARSARSEFSKRKIQSKSFGPIPQGVGNVI